MMHRMIHTIILMGSNEEGWKADLSGIHQSKLARVVQMSQTHIVLHQAGHSENPGSRYSGLNSYYPPNVTVYEIKERLSEREFRAVATISWDAGKGDNASRPYLPPMEGGAT